MKKWSTKKKVYSIIGLVLAAAIIAGVCYGALKPEKGAKVTLATIGKGNITQTLETTGTVESANQGSFTVLDGTVVSAVNVRVGDMVKKGELLASFDTSALAELVSEKKKAFNSAEDAYNNYKTTAASSSGDLSEIDSQIKELESKMVDLQAAVDAQSDTAAQEASTNETGSKLRKFLGLDNSNTVLGKISDLLGGNSSSAAAVSSMMSGGLGSSFDFSSIGSMLGKSDEEQELISATLELVQLKARQTLLQTQNSGTLGSVYKTVYENAEKAYESAKSAVELLDKGWYAENDGIVREVNITAGETYKHKSSGAGEAAIDVSSILSMITSSTGTSDITDMISGLFADTTAGMVIEYYPFEVKFVLGKYDVAKVHMDQKATLTSINGDEFEGKIVYISPVASSESSINISSLLGSSGSSSGVEVRVSVPHPDESIIIGFDIDVSLDVNTSENAVLVPMGALQYDTNGLIHVFVYNEKTKTVKSTDITTGLFDGSNYEVLTGLKEGDVIVKNPQTTLKDGDKITIKTLEEESTEAQTK